MLRGLPKYRKHVWEPRNDPALPLGSFDGYADAIESAIYLVSREPVPEAFDWIDSEMDVMLRMQRADGHIEDWYGEGNFNRTALLYAYHEEPAASGQNAGSPASASARSQTAHACCYTSRCRRHDACSSTSPATAA